MNTTLTRRGFIAGLTAVAATRARCFGGAPGGARYSVAVLGDTHYDAEPESVYHSHYDESNKWAKIQHAEFRRNGEMWRERCRRLVEASATVASRLDTRFILQMGDLVQGDCDDVPTHVKMLEDAIGVMREPFARRNAARPFLTVIGNHDFRGKGARDAYLDFSRRFMGAEMLRLTGEECAAEYPVFSFRLGGDLWVFCDFERSDLQPVIDAVEGATARHVFLVTHGPFTAADSNSFRWRLGGSRKCDALRPRLYEALSRRHAVVLSGHTHTTTFFRHENAFGGFCEFTANSVWEKPELATGDAVYSTVEEYGARRLAQLSGEKREDFKASLAFFRPGLREYFFSDAAGHCRLDVADGSVRMSFYPGDALSPAWSVEMCGKG